MNEFVISVSATKILLNNELKYISVSVNGIYIPQIIDVTINPNVPDFSKTIVVEGL